MSQTAAEALTFLVEAGGGEHLAVGDEPLASDSGTQGCRAILRHGHFGVAVALRLGALRGGPVLGWLREMLGEAPHKAGPA